MCRAEGAEPATVYREKVVVARKEHRCEECRRTISVGEPYRYAFSLYEGYVDNYHTCAHCCAGQDWLIRECGGYIFSEVAEELLEHAYDYPTIAIPLRRLYKGIMRQWRWFNGEQMRIPHIPSVAIEHVVHP